MPDLESPTVVETPPVVPVVEVPPAAVDADTLDDLDPNAPEPGGADPQAIRARKEYRARKRAETAAQSEREQRIALEARLQALEETREERRAAQPVVPPVTRYTGVQLQEAVDTGRITTADMIEYMAETKATQVRATQRVRDTQDSQERDHQKTAMTELDAYAKAYPQLTGEHPQRSAIQQEYRRLTEDFGLPGDIRTQLMAIKLVLGPVSRLGEQKVSRDAARVKATQDLHAETGGTGTAGAPAVTPAAIDAQISKLPAIHQEYIKRRGLLGKELEGYVKALRERPK